MADRMVTRGPDALGLLMAVLFLGVATVGFTGTAWWLLGGTWKWIAAAIVALIGVVMVVSSLPGRSRSRDVGGD